jgi:sugar phosphate isomerase/epimerase
MAVALTICLSLGAASTAAASGKHHGSRGVPDQQISIQLWTFSQYIGFGTDAATIARTEEVFGKLRSYGYRNVEPFTLSGLTATQYRALLDKYGLKASARHVDVGTPEKPADIDQIIADNKTLGIKYFGSGATPIFPPIYTTEAQWVAYAKYLNEVGAKARQAGQRLMVHNHDIEFSTKFGDRTVFDILAANTDPRNVVFQLDLYWVTYGGADPIAVLKRYGKRIQLFHVKDMKGSDRSIEIVGRGIINFPKIFAAGKHIRYYVVEHDPPQNNPNFDPFEAAKVGFDYLDHVRFWFHRGHHNGHHKGHHTGHGRGHDTGPGRGHDKSHGRGHDRD